MVRSTPGFAGLLAVALVASLAASSSAPADEVIVVPIDTIIHPVAAEFLIEGIDMAEEVDATALVVELDTPGGLMTSMREMTTAILGAEVPVVVYVAPSGAQAASAGFFVLQAADIAAMAPGTNTGAAHPVAAQGEDIEGDMGAKVEQDAAAQIRALARRHGRNVELAEAAVVESRSFTAHEALEENLIELVAPSLEELLDEIDGLEVEKDGETVRLATAGSDVRRLEMSPVQKLLSVISHPNVAYILFTLGFLGLYFEFANPGVILPGVIGAICLILGFYALSVLPVNVAGIALMLLAMLFFIAEVKVTSYGMLTAAGVIALVVGSLMLFKSASPAIRVSVWLIAAVSGAIAVVAVFLTGLVVRAHQQQVATGIEGLVGKQGRVRHEIGPGRRGKVFVHGEIWDAESAVPIASGKAVEVVAVDGPVLEVRPVSNH